MEFHFNVAYLWQYNGNREPFQNTYELLKLRAFKMSICHYIVKVWVRYICGISKFPFHT